MKYTLTKFIPSAQFKENLPSFLNTEKTILLIIIILSFLLRIYFTSQVNEVPVKDAAEYDQIAMNLVNGKGFSNYEGNPTASIPPLYPLFLSLIYRVFGHNYLVVKIIQSILGSLTCVVIYFTGKEVFNRNIGILSAYVASMYPPFITFYYGPASLLAETLFILLFSLAVLFLLKFIEEASAKNSLITGIILGLTTLTRGVTLLFPVIIFIWLLFIKVGRRKLLRNFTILMISFIVVLSPWIIRNYIVYKKIVPISTDGGISFYASNNPESKGLGTYSEVLIYDKKLKAAGFSEAERSNIFFKKGIDFLKQNPGKAVKLFLRKFLLFWDTSYVSYTSKTRQIKYNYLYGMLLPFSILGLIVFLREEYKKEILLFFFIIAYFSIFHTIFHTSIRYRAPVEPYLILLGTSFIYFLINKISNKRTCFLFFSLIIIGNVYIYINYSTVFSVVRRMVRLFGLG